MKRFLQIILVVTFIMALPIGNSAYAEENNVIYSNDNSVVYQNEGGLVVGSAYCYLQVYMNSYRELRMEWYA